MSKTQSSGNSLEVTRQERTKPANSSSEHSLDILDTTLEKLQTLERGDFPKEFITRDSLYSQWTQQALGDFFAHFGLDLSADQIVYVQENLLQLLSTLVSVHFKSWTAFNDYYFGKDANKSITDKDLPLSGTKLERPQYINKYLWNDFRRAEHRFCPVIIKYGSDKKYDGLRRFPFISITNITRRGFFSTVSIVGIPHGYLLDRENCPIAEDETYVVALKRFRTHGASYHFRAELGILEELSKNPVSHANIVCHLAAAQSDSELSIIFPRAAMDLEDFFQLNTGQPNLVECIDQCRALAEAIDFLHTKLEIKTPDSASPRFICHMDIKPANILVFDIEHTVDPNDPVWKVGSWKLTDFGIAKLRAPETSWDLTDPTIQTYTRQNAGPYQAPEVSEKKRIGRSADIWSLGCVFCCASVYGLGGSISLERFNTERAQTLEGEDYDHDYFHRDGQVNPCVVRWIQSLDSDGSNVGKSSLKQLLTCMLSIQADARPEAKQVCSDLTVARDQLQHKITMPNGDQSAPPKTSPQSASDEPLIGISIGQDREVVDRKMRIETQAERKYPQSDSSRRPSLEVLQTEGRWNPASPNNSIAFPSRTGTKIPAVVFPGNINDSRRSRPRSHLAGATTPAQKQSAPSSPRIPEDTDASYDSIPIMPGLPESQRPAQRQLAERDAEGGQGPILFWVPATDIDIVVLAAYLKEFVDPMATINPAPFSGISDYAFHGARRSRSGDGYGFLIGSRASLTERGYRDVLKDSAAWEEEKSRISRGSYGSRGSHRYLDSVTWQERRRRGLSPDAVNSSTTYSRGQNPSDRVLLIDTRRARRHALPVPKGWAVDSLASLNGATSKKERAGSSPDELQFWGILDSGSQYAERSSRKGSSIQGIESGRRRIVDDTDASQLTPNHRHGSSDEDTNPRVQRRRPQGSHETSRLDRERDRDHSSPSVRREEPRSNPNAIQDRQYRRDVSSAESRAQGRRRDGRPLESVVERDGRGESNRNGRPDVGTRRTNSNTSRLPSNAEASPASSDLDQDERHGSRANASWVLDRDPGRSSRYPKQEATSKHSRQERAADRPDTRQSQASYRMEGAHRSTGRERDEMEGHRPRSEQSRRHETYDQRTGPPDATRHVRDTNPTVMRHGASVAHPYSNSRLPTGSRIEAVDDEMNRRRAEPREDRVQTAYVSRQDTGSRRAGQDKTAPQLPRSRHAPTRRRGSDSDSDSDSDSKANTSAGYRNQAAGHRMDRARHETAHRRGFDSASDTRRIPAYQNQAVAGHSTTGQTRRATILDSDSASNQTSAAYRMQAAATATPRGKGHQTRRHAATRHGGSDSDSGVDLEPPDGDRHGRRR